MKDRAEFACPDCNRFFKADSRLDAHIRGQITCDTCARAFCAKTTYRNSKNHGPQCDRRVLCPVCNLMVIKLARHMISHSIEKSLACDHCSKTYRVREALLQHLQTVHTDVMYSCLDCDKQFLIKSDLERHFACHFRRLVCPSCKRSFLKAYAYNKHMRSHTEGRSCKECKRSFHEIKTLNLHVKKQNTCAICSKVFCSLLEYYSNLHRSVCAGATTCLICEEKFPASYKKHYLSKHLDKQARALACEICGKLYSTSNAVKKHIDAIHSNIKYDCNECGKTFSDQSYYAYHVRGHKTTFTCQTCPLTFSHQAHYRRHLKVCQKPRRTWVCDVCGKKLASNSTLGLHKRMHTGEKPFKCQICGRSFARQATYKDHLLTHARKKPHTCPTCGKGFTQRTACTVHMRSHNSCSESAKSRTCCICGSEFSTLGQLRAHLVKTHNAEMLF